MQVLYLRCAGLDVHKDMVMARVRCVSEPGHDEVRSFDTTTSALRMLISQTVTENSATGQIVSSVSNAAQFTRCRTGISR